jgi:regulator of sigma D
MNAKAKNSALDVDSAKNWFKALSEAGDEVTDSEGPDPENKKRVSVKIADMITSRETDILAQGLKILHASNKKASPEDVEKAEHRLQTQGPRHIQAVLSIRGRVVNMTHASQTQDDGMDGGKFLAGGKAALSMGPLGEYLSEEDSEGDAGRDADGEKDEEDDAGGVADNRSSASTDPASKKPKLETVWHNKDDEVTAALAVHMDWEKKAREKLESCMRVMNETLTFVEPSIAYMVENEKNIFNTRHLALKLVLGLGSTQDAQTDETLQLPGPENSLNANAKHGGTSALSSKLDAARKQLEGLTRDKNVAEMAVEHLKPCFTDANLKLEKSVKSRPEGESDIAEALQGDRDALAKMKGAIDKENAKVDEINSNIAAATQEVSDLDDAMIKHNIEKGSTVMGDELDTASEISRLVKSSGSNERALQQYIASFSIGDRTQLGRTLPCRSYQSLRTLAEFDAITKEINASTSKTQLHDIRKMWKTFKDALNDIVTMSKAADKRLVLGIQKAVDTKESAKMVSSKAGADRSKLKVAKSTKHGQPNLFELAATLARTVARVRHDSQDFRVESSKLLAPLVVTISKSNKEVKLLSVEAANVYKCFRADPARLRPGRRQRHLSPAAEVSFRRLTDGFLNHDDDYAKIGDGTSRSMLSTFFCIAQDSETCSAEANHCSCIRLGLKGTRQVLLTRFMDFVRFLGLTVPLSTLQPKAVYNHFKDMNGKNLEEYAKANEVFACTLAPCDVLCCPPGMLFYERVSKSCDYVGIRCQVLAPNHSVCLEEISTHLINVGKANAPLQHIVSALGFMAD